MSGELLGRVLLAPAVEQDSIGRNAARLAIQPRKQGRFRVEELGLAGKITGAALQIIIEESFDGFVLRAGLTGDDGGKGQFHRWNRSAFACR